MKKLGIRRMVVAFLLMFSAVFNLLSWISRPFADFYTNNIFPFVTTGYGRLTSRASFSVGERLLVLLVVIAAVTAIILLTRCVFFLMKKEFPKGLSSFARHYFRGLSVLFSLVLVIMSLNCFVLYHCTPLRAAPVTRDDYTTEELAVLRDMIVAKCNTLAEDVERDESGFVLYNGDMAEAAGEAVLGISGEFGDGRLGGFYVTPKVLTFSGFMSQQYMQGYYFPFSMEANINGEMYIMNKPFTMCHELAHTKGYIYEDEANFLGFMACINSGDKVFEYSGYLGVLNYVNNDFYRSVDRQEYDKHVSISDRVRFDDQFLTDEAWDEVEKRALLKTETVKKAADTFIDTNLKVNGVSEGKASYNKVVKLLLDYYGYHSYN